MSEGYDLRVICLGAGVQSSTMYRLAARGDFPDQPDYAIFADTQSEPPWVYENLHLLEEDHGDEIPIIRATAGDIREAVEAGSNPTGQRFASIPFWVRGEDGRGVPGRRHCTREYKIDVVKRAIRDLLGLEPRQHAKGKFRVEEWIGISLDEAQRAKPSRTSWITTRWPLIFDRPMRRSECKAWLRGHGYPVPGKSACTFCPYRRADQYAKMRDEHPEVFEEACKIDDQIRSSGTMRGMESEQYVLRTLEPLRDLPPTEELEGDSDQLDLFANECEGMCGL